MKFQLTDELKNHMISKNLDNIVLETKIRSCWSGSYAEVSAKFGNSPNNGFDVHEVDGFRVYVQPGIKADKEIVTLGLEKMLFLERITIDGIRTVWQRGAKHGKTLAPHLIAQDQTGGYAHRQLFYDQIYDQSNDYSMIIPGSSQ